MDGSAISVCLLRQARLAACPVTAALLIATASPMVVAEPPYTAVPLVTCADPQVFRDVLLGSQSGLVRVAVLGDSQETCPGGWGAHYLVHLNALLAATFGPATESIVFEPEWWWSEPSWLGTSALLDGGGQVPQIAPGELLPGMKAAVLAGPSGAQATFVTVFLPGADACVSEELRFGPWFGDPSTVVAEVLVSRRDAPGVLEWSFAPTPSSAPDAGAVPVAAGTWSVPAREAGLALEWLSTPAFDVPAGQHAQVRLSAVDGQAVDCLGIRYRTASSQHGVAVQGFSKGGMKLGDFLTDFADSGAALRAIEPAVVVLHWGANDAGMTPVAEWRDQLAAVIARVRAELGNPLLPIIIAGDPPRDMLTPDAPFHEYPAIAAELAGSDPALLALNLRRAEEEAFAWDAAANLATADGVHYRPHGQRMLGYAFVGTLLEGLAMPMAGIAPGSSWREAYYPLGASCIAEFPCHRLVEADALAAELQWSPGADCTDADGDGTADVCVLPSSADINGDGIVGGADLALLLSAWGSADDAADCSNDGTVDGVDLTLLLSAWGTAG